MARVVKQQSLDTFDEGLHSPLEGQVCRIGTYHQEAKNGQEERDARFMIVHSKGRFFRVYESAGLKDAFEQAAPNDFVLLEFTGIKKTGKGRTMKAFNTTVWTDTDAEPAPEPPKDPWSTEEAAKPAKGRAKK